MRQSTEGPCIGRRTRLHADKPVGGVQRGSRSEPLCVSVSALFDPSAVDLGELQHVSGPLLRVLMQLEMFKEEDDA